MLTNPHIAKLVAAERIAGRRDEAEVSNLVVAAAAGDGQAWEALVGAFSGLIASVARAHRLREADAADVIQATWLKLFEHLGRIRDPARVGGWLATTARHECLRVLRGHERNVLIGDDAPERESGDAPPDAVMIMAERDDALWRGFARLRPSDQILLGVLLGQASPPYERISALLGMPIGSIGPTRQRAIDRLRRELERQGTLSLLNPGFETT